MTASVTGVALIMNQCSAEDRRMFRVDSGKKPGAYCGNNDETSLKVKAIVVIANSTIAIAGQFNGRYFSCPNEKYIILENNTVVFPGAFQKNDCLGAIFISNNVNPYTVTVLYDPKQDSATIVGPQGFNLSLHACDPSSRIRFMENSEKMEQLLEKKQISLREKPSADPAGAYCGSYDDIAVVQVQVVSLTSVNLAGSVFGTNVSCAGEKVAYNPSNGTINFPNIDAPSDCLGSMLSGYGVQPDSLKCNYIDAQNIIEVQVEGVTIDLKKCGTWKNEKIHLKYQ